MTEFIHQYVDTRTSISDLSNRLSTLYRQRDKHKRAIERIEEEALAIAREINGKMGIGLAPISEVVDKVHQHFLEKKEETSTKRSEGMKNTWSKKTPEEREAWKRKIREGRWRNHENK